MNMPKGVNGFDAIIATPLPSPLNRIAIHVNNDNLQQLEFVNHQHSLKAPTQPYAKFVAEQLQRYFDDPRHRFDIKLDPQGTEYQKRVWKQLRLCPPGQIWCYSELANRVSSGARAVGNACRRNPIPLIVPCHRIVSKQGIGGFAGKTSGNLLTIKKWLLHHETSY